MSNHYEVLGVTEEATQDEIKQAYRKKASDAHPDRDGGDAEAMALINQAYEVLGDPKRRQDYDDGGSGRASMDLDSMIAKSLVALIGRVLDMSGNLVVNATKILNSEKKIAKERIAESKILIARAEARKALITAKEAPSGNVAHLLLDRQIEDHGKTIAQMEAHLLVLAGVESELNHYEDAQPDPNQGQFQWGGTGAAYMRTF